MSARQRMPLTLLTANEVADGVKDLEDVRKGCKKRASRGPPVGAGPRVPLLRLFINVTKVAETEGAKTEKDFRVLGC